MSKSLKAPSLTALFRESAVNAAIVIEELAAVSAALSQGKGGLEGLSRVREGALC